MSSPTKSHTTGKPKRQKNMRVLSAYHLSIQPQRFRQLEGPETPNREDPKMAKFVNYLPSPCTSSYPSIVHVYNFRSQHQLVTFTQTETTKRRRKKESKKERKKNLMKYLSFIKPMYTSSLYSASSSSSSRRHVIIPILLSIATTPLEKTLRRPLQYEEERHGCMAEDGEKRLLIDIVFAMMDYWNGSNKKTTIREARNMFEKKEGKKAMI
ncbi:uncharacterized protein CLUP02_16465 [Colletotrichum lupini]|uniref:Uncharacterized protein n=1 Tax=Colletotrichum lupini TaxID=145971 RepID=A0A9Q8T8N4_9PEZI|nr:uncharacterized protein CLUP02_16465 [Colletotrichum lupini]UQC90933.1 hypothetical protein CLUP02_16465 [Colletotrichum lupini]